MKHLTPRQPAARILNGLLAALALTGTFLQLLHRALYLPADQGIGFILGAFLYFTILSNALIGLTALLAALRPGTFPSLRGAATLYITITGLIYFLLLRDLPIPQDSLFLISNQLVHNVTPPLALLLWINIPPAAPLSLRRDSLRWLAFPLAYAVFTLLRGSLVRWYPYPFSDITAQGLPQVLLNFAVILTVFWILGALLILVSRLLTAQR